MADTSQVQVPLDERERAFLRAALMDWGGPARPTDDLAVALSFTNADSLSGEASRLWDRIEAGETLSLEDWRRTLVAVEVVFVSDVFGSGLDWRHTTGFSDEESLTLLRSIQRKMPRWRESVQFTVTDAGEVRVTDPERLKT